MTLVGIDGSALSLLLSHRPPRSSADTLIPQLLPLLRDARLVIIGSTKENNGLAANRLGRLLGPGSEVVQCLDGYAGLDSLDWHSRDWRLDAQPTVVIVGLGAAIQEEFAVAVARHMPYGLVITCGGFLDQVIRERYYPAWAYPLRLNWLVRLAREPRRLWRRYTMDAIVAILTQRRLRTATESLPGYQAYLAEF